ncbi:unnamed protein product [Plutella xylostella]|uniref:(diamondback moth) hypothetical protein n=1 Tax=Plutella xylostella TaxID=51655 RepID=A0A8S4DIL1_PLUXY|nr:unnamed protein product [Plutella xylostella]
MRRAGARRRRLRRGRRARRLRLRGRRERRQVHHQVTKLIVCKSEWKVHSASSESSRIPCIFHNWRHVTGLSYTPTESSNTADVKAQILTATAQYAARRRAAAAPAPWRTGAPPAPAGPAGTQTGPSPGN